MRTRWSSGHILFLRRSGGARGTKVRSTTRRLRTLNPGAQERVHHLRRDTSEVMLAFIYKPTDQLERQIAPHVLWITEAQGACVFGLQEQSETGTVESSPQHFDPFKMRGYGSSRRVGKSIRRSSARAMRTSSASSLPRGSAGRAAARVRVKSWSS